MTFKITQGHHQCDILVSDRGCAIHRKPLYVYFCIASFLLLCTCSVLL